MSSRSSLEKLSWVVGIASSVLAIVTWFQEMKPKSPTQESSAATIPDETSVQAQPVAQASQPSAQQPQPNDQASWPAVRAFQPSAQQLPPSFSPQPSSQVFYRARLSARDHFNSNGEPLQSAALVLRQDRVNYHRNGALDSEDTSDPVFVDKAFRAYLFTSDRLRASEQLQREIVIGQPFVEVHIFDDHINVRQLPE